MTHTPELNASADTLPLTTEHPAYKKLVEKISELERDGVTPDSEEYVTEVEKFARAEPQLATVLANENSHLANVLTRMSGEEDVSNTALELESLPGIEIAHRRAFATAQEMRQFCNKVAVELKNRADRGLTPLIDENHLRGLYHSAQPFEDALSSNQTDNAVEAIHQIVRAFSSIEKGYSVVVSEDVESLKKLGFYIKEFGEQSSRLARVYGEFDTPEALEISSSALTLRDVTEEKLQLLSRMLRALLG